MVNIHDLWLPLLSNTCTLYCAVIEHRQSEISYRYETKAHCDSSTSHAHSKPSKGVKSYVFIRLFFCF